MMVVTSTRSVSMVLRYIPKSQRKDDQSLVSECSIPKSTTKVDSSESEVNWAIHMLTLEYNTQEGGELCHYLIFANSQLG